MKNKPIYRRSSVDVTCCFPRYGQKSDEFLQNLIKKAERSLDIAIFNFTDKIILQAMLGAISKGVSMRILTDKTMLLNPKQALYMRKLKKAGAKIKRSAHRGFMHLKMTIADQKIVAVGSANFTKSSQSKNDEIFLILNNGIAVDFAAQFQIMWEDSRSFRPF